MGSGNIIIEGGSGTGIIVDQSYNPTSENPQSGKALSEELYTKVEIPADDIYTIIFNENYEPANGVYKITSTRDNFFDAYYLYADFGYVVINNEYAKYRLHDTEYIYVEFDEQSSEVSKLIVYISKYTIHKIRTFSNGARLGLENNVEYIADGPINYLSISWDSDENFNSSITFTVGGPLDTMFFDFPNTTKYIGDAPVFKPDQTWKLNIKDGVMVAGLVEGNIIDIPGLQGENVTDQTYNPTSKNAQSGIAVNEALSVFKEFKISGPLEFDELVTPNSSVIAEVTEISTDIDSDGSGWYDVFTDFHGMYFRIVQESGTIVDISVGDKVYVEIGERANEFDYYYTPGKAAVIREKYVAAEKAEKLENKVTSLDSNSTDEQYPSAKAVYDALQNVEGGDSTNIEVDQSYNPTSENPQSGKALSEELYTKVEIPAESIYAIWFNEGYERTNGLYKITSTDCSNEAYKLHGDFGYVVLDSGSVVKYRLHDTEYIYVEFDEQSSEVSKLIVYISKCSSHKTLTFSSTIDTKYLYLEDNVEYIIEKPISELSVFYPSGNFISSITFTVSDYGIEIYLSDTTKYIGGVPEFKNGQTWELNIKDGVLVGGLVQ